MKKPKAACYTSSSLMGLPSPGDTGFRVSILPRQVAAPELHEVPTLPDVDAMEIAIHHADPVIPLASEIVRILANVTEEQIGRAQGCFSVVDPVAVYFNRFIR